MAIDPLYNLKFTTVASVSDNDITVDDPSMLRDSGTFIPSNFLVWAAGESPTPSNSEYVRPTADASGTFTLSRQQEGSSLRTIQVGDYIALTPTAKTFQDIQDQIDAIPGGGGGGTWGSITGTLADQTDLQTALDGKAASAHTHDSDDIDVPLAGVNLTQVVTDVSASLETKANNTEVVHRIGTETVDGVKTFTSSPVVPTPTTDMQAATKKYVDDNAGGGGSGVSSLAKSGETSLTGDVTISAGSNVTLTQSGNNIEVAASGGGGGGSSTPSATMALTYSSGTDHNTEAINSATATYNQSSQGFLRLAAGTTAGGRASSYWGATDQRKGYTIKNPRCATALGFSNTTTGNGNAYYNFFTSSANGSAMTADHIGYKGLKVSGTTTIYSSTGDGTTETATALTGLSSLSHMRSYSAVLTEGTNCKFYYDGVLKNTHTTNLPRDPIANVTATRQYWSFGFCDNASTTDDYWLNIVYFSMTWDLY